MTITSVSTGTCGQEEQPSSGGLEVPGERSAGVGPLVREVPSPEDDGGPALVLHHPLLPHYADAPPGRVVTDHLRRRGLFRLSSEEDFSHLAIVIPEDVFRPLERVDDTGYVDERSLAKVNIRSTENVCDRAGVVRNIQAGRLGYLLGVVGGWRWWRGHWSGQAHHSYLDRVAVDLTLVVAEVLITEAAYH